MVVRCREIPFFGHLIGENGIHPDPTKIQAIVNMADRENFKELQTFLGMSNYLSCFTPKLASLSAPIHDLCKKESDFCWGSEHREAFMKVKDKISGTTSLQFYDSKKPLILQVDSHIQHFTLSVIF